MEKKSVTVKVLAKKQETLKKLGQIIHLAEDFFLLSPEDDRRPELLIYELGTDAKSDLQHLSGMLKESGGPEIFLTQENPEPSVLMEAIRIGTKEFLSQPLVDEDVQEALSRYRQRRDGSRQPVQEKLGKVINVIGSKGGVGSTTIAVNLAANLAGMETVGSVALVDMNMLFGEIPLFLEMKPKYHWGEIAKQVHRLDKDFLMNILSQHSSGVYVLSSPTDIHYDQEKVAKIMERLLGLMKKMFDFVIIDTGHSLDRVSVTTLKLADHVLLVSILSLPCLANANKLLESFLVLGFPSRDRLKIVINRYMKNAEISLKDAEENIQKSIFWTFPNDYQATMSAINQGKPLSMIASRAAISRSLQKMAETLVQGDEEEQQKRRWFFKPKKDRPDEIRAMSGTYQE